MKKERARMIEEEARRESIDVSEMNKVCAYWLF